MDADSMMKKIADTLDVDPDLISLETTADEIEAWDSMGTMSLLLMLSQDLGINLPPNQTDQLQSVERILGLINKGEAPAS